MQVVATARSCAEALEKIGQVVPDVILLDLDLNGESALDILPALLANAVSRVLVLTGERQQAILDRAVLSGVRGLLRKDASAELVLKAIEKVHQGELWLDQSTLARVVGGLIAPPAPARAMPDPERAKQAALTGREREIIGRVVAESGAMNKVLARQLFISEHTLRNHLTSIYQKLEVGNRLELYFYAVKHKLGTTS
jgi:DNA-binding NarL/FixJ family response regulator